MLGIMGCGCAVFARVIGTQYLTDVFSDVSRALLP
jgi:hypothetical protein